MAKMSNRVICLILTVLMIVGMVPVAGAQYAYNEADSKKTYYDVDYSSLVGTANQSKRGVYIVDSDWEFEENEAPATVTFKFRGVEYTENYNPDRHLFKFSDVYVKAKEQGISLPTCILTEGNYSGNGTLTLSSSIILLGAKAGINPNVPNADPTKEWALNSNRYYNDDIAEEDTGGESRLWTPGAENPDVGYVEGSSSQYTDKILKITQSTGTGTFVIDGLFFQGYAACLDATANGSGTWNIYVQNCIFGNCYSYDTETLRFWNRGGSMSIAKKLYLSNAYVRDNNKNGFYSGHAQTIHINGLNYQNSAYTCFYNVQNIPWQGYDFSCENSHFWNPDGFVSSGQMFDFNMTSYSNVGPGSETDANVYSIKNNSFYNMAGTKASTEIDEETGKPVEYYHRGNTIADCVIGGPNDKFTFEDNIIIDANDAVTNDTYPVTSALKLYFTCDKNTNLVTHGWANDSCSTTMLDPNYVLGEEQVNVNNNTIIGKNYMASALHYHSGGVLNDANFVKMQGNLYLPSLDATEGQLVSAQVGYEAYGDQFYDEWVWMDKAMTVKSSALYEEDFSATATGHEIAKDGENWSIELPYNVYEVAMETACHEDNSVKIYESNAAFEKGDVVDDNILDTSERTSYYVVSLISIDGHTTKDYKLTVKRAANPAAALKDVIADSSVGVDLKETYGDAGFRFEVNYDSSSFKFTLDITEGATAAVKSKAAGTSVNPSNGVYTIRLTSTEQDYNYVVIVTDAEGNYEKYDLVMYRRLSTHADIERLSATGCEVTADEANHTYNIVADATASEVEFTVKVSTNAVGVLTDNIYGAEIKATSTGIRGTNYTVDVSAGENIYNLTVTAQDGVTVIVWKIIVSRPKNTACELISIDDAVKGEDDVYTADVATATFFVNAVSSTSSTYHIYTDSACTQEIADPLLTLDEAQTVIWLQIHAEDTNYKSIPYKVVINTTADLSNQEPGALYLPMKDDGIIGVTGAAEFEDGYVYVDLPEDVEEFALKVVGKNGHQVYLFADPNMDIIVEPEQILKIDCGFTNLYALARKGDDVYPYVIAISSDRHYDYSDTLTPWAEPYIEYLNDTGFGLLKGDENGAFNGNNNLTRYELATIMVRLSGLNKDFYARCDVTFTDEIVPWAENYVKAAVKIGLMNGYATYEGEDIVGYTFQGNKKATRAEFIRVLMNSLFGDIDAFYEERKEEIAADAAAFELKDFDQIPEWAKSSMHTAIVLEIISGDDNGNIRANGNITRNEAATIIARLIGTFA